MRGAVKPDFRLPLNEHLEYGLPLSAVKNVSLFSFK